MLINCNGRKILILNLIFSVIIFACQTWDTINDVEYTDSVDDLINYTINSETEIRERALIKLCGYNNNKKVFKTLIANLDTANKNIKNRIINYIGKNYTREYDTIYLKILNTENDETLIILLKALKNAEKPLSKKLFLSIKRHYKSKKWDIQLYSVWINAQNGDYDGIDTIINLMYSDYVIAARLAGKVARLFKNKIMYVALTEYINISDDEIAKKNAIKSLAIIKQTVKVSEDEYKAQIALMPQNLRNKVKLSSNNSLLIIGMKSHTIDNSLCESILNAFTTSINSIGIFKIVSEEQRKHALKELEFALSDISSDQDKIKLGKMVAAHYFLSGQIEQLYDKSISLSINIVDIETALTVSGYSKVFNNINQIFSNKNKISFELLQPFL